MTYDVAGIQKHHVYKEKGRSTELPAVESSIPSLDTICKKSKNWPDIINNLRNEFLFIKAMICTRA